MFSLLLSPPKIADSHAHAKFWAPRADINIQKEAYANK